MNDATYTYMLQQLQNALQSGQIIAPESELGIYIADKPTIHGALMLIVAGELGISPEKILSPTPEGLLHDLAAFIDKETSESTAAALRAYPHVWWQICVSSEFYSTYQFTRILLDSRHSKELIVTLPSSYREYTHKRRLVKLKRNFLNLALPAQASLLGHARGSDDDEVILFQEDSSDGEYIRLVVQQQPDKSWCIKVTIMPPPHGQLVLSLGTTVFRASFGDDGVALISDIQTSLLTAIEGPDLTIDIEDEIEPDSEDSAEP